jgi:hypothetical protein
MYRSLLIIAVCLFLPFTAATQPMPGDAETINGFNIYKTLDRLASQEFQGRHTGHEGYTDAASWVAEMFDKWGLEPVSEEHGYLLPFPVQYTIIDDAFMSIYIVDEDADAGYREIVLEPEVDFLPLLYSDSADRTAEVVFIGWGIHAPDLGYDDYFGVDVLDKFVMCFRGTPDPQDRRFQYHDEHRTRMQRAKEMGAIGLIYIYEEPIANPNGDWIENFTPVKISYTTADKLIGTRGFNASDLRADLLKYKRPLSFEVNSRVRIQVASTHFPDATGFNVVGFIEGVNPELRDEVIVVGAHLDHCGTHMGLMFPGADDNASGSAVVMEIARAFAVNNVRTGRSVLFALFGGEEMGLLGSRYLVENFPEQFMKISYMINFDMVGAGDGAVCGFSTGHPDLRDLVESMDIEVRTIRRYFPIRDLGVRGSDHAAFHARGVPVLYFVSNGPHIRYHTTGDTIYRMNPSVMQDIARIGYLTAIGLGNR